MVSAEVQHPVSADGLPVGAATATATAARAAERDSSSSGSTSPSSTTKSKSRTSSSSSPICGAAIMVEGEGKGSEEPEARWTRTLVEVLRIALPSVAGCVLMVLNELVNVLFLGHIGDQAALAGVGLGNMMQNCVALSVSFGLAGALDTLVSQSHGAGQHTLSCHYLQRCRILLALQLLWMVPLLWFSGSILTWIREDADVARHAQAYNRASVWGLFAILQYEATRRFLFNRSDTMPPLCISVATSLLHIGWCYFLITHSGLGIAGAGCANTITWWSKCLLGSLYLVYDAKRSGFTCRAVLWIEEPGFREWTAFMRLAVPSAVQLCSEWWFWEITTLIVGYLGKTTLAAHVATCNWTDISIMPAFGVSAATATLVGNAIGANSPGKAKMVLKLNGVLMLAISGTIASCMVLGREPLSLVYSDDEDIRQIMQRLLCIASVNNLLDSTKTVMGGALRGVGRQSLAAATYLAVFYGVAMPGGILAAFPLHLGVDGIWYFFCSATGLSNAIFAMALARTDWKLLASETSARVHAEGCLAEQSQASGLAEGSRLSGQPAVILQECDDEEAQATGC